MNRLILHLNVTQAHELNDPNKPLLNDREVLHNTSLDKPMQRKQRCLLGINTLKQADYILPGHTAADILL